MSKSRWLDQIDRLTHDFKHAFGGLNAQELNWKPNDHTWSIAQNIDHLIVTNESYYPLIDSVRKGNYRLPLTSKIGFMVRMLGKAILRSVQPDRKRKIKTFSIWEPAKSKIDADIVLHFEKHQEKLKQFIKDCSDLVEKGTVVSSPANRRIVYRLEDAFDILVAHEARHLQQAKEVLALQKRG